MPTWPPTCLTMGSTPVQVGQQRPSAPAECVERQAKLYPDVKADGAIGPRSLSALESYIKARGTGGKRLLAEAVNSLRIAHCVITG